MFCMRAIFRKREEISHSSFGLDISKLIFRDYVPWGNKDSDKKREMCRVNV